MSDLKWGFWKISGWYGTYSKYHIFYDNKTLCGLYPNPEIGSKTVFAEAYHNNERCKRCVRSQAAFRRKKNN